jgi:HK97 family phage major capsid protein
MPTMPKNAKQLAGEMEEMWARAEREGRDLTAGERSQMEQLVEAAKSQHSLEQQIKSFGEGFMPSFVTADPNADWTSGGPGDVFVRSAGWKSVSDPSSRGQQWSTGLVEVGPLQMKGTLLEGSGSPGSGSGGGLLATPQVVPGVVETLFQPLTLESLFGSGVATGNTVRYALEGTATSGAAGVAEGGLKPESTLGLSVRDEPVKKIATSIVLSDEIAEDAPSVQTFLNQRLSLFVNIETERQLLRGAAGGNEIQGLLTSRSVPIYAGGTAAGNKAEQIFKAMNGLRGSAFLEPEWVIVHPTDYEAIRLLKDTANQYYGGGPFLGSYGNPTQVAASGQVTGAIDSLWGKAVYVTPIVGAGTAVAGTRAGATVWSRGGLSVEITNSHSDLFVRNLLAMRAERRAALSVYRPGAFVEIRLG